MTLSQQIRHHFFTRAFLLFLVIGCVNTFNGTLFSWFFTHFYNSNLAFNLGYILANFIAYALNSFIVFPEELSWRRYIRFAISYIPNYIIQNIIVFVFYNMLGLPDIISYLIAAVLGIPVTFLFVKIFAFGRT